jgi:diguanylate cyclase (GGDEF)-like protein
VIGGGLPISMTLAIIFLLVAAISGVVVMAVVSYQQRSSVSEMAVAESRRTADLIFEHLYSVMRKGWSRDDIDEIVDRLNMANPQVTVSVVRSTAVAEQFGDIAADAFRRTNDPLIAQALDTGDDLLVEHNGSIRYLHPVRSKTECLECHEAERPGTVNGLIEIIMPTDQLRLPLEFTIRSAIYSFGVAVFVLFIAVFLKLRLFIISPIVDLASHLQGIMDADALERRIAPKSIWPREVRLLARDFNALMDDLERSRRNLVDQSTRDALTGLYNRRYFDALCRREVARAQRYHRPLSLLMLDLDRFKPINDTFGHAAGDHLLVHLAEVLERNLRESDVAARIGGDEFIVLSSETDGRDARKLAEKIRAILTDAHVDYGEHRLDVGVSVGVASLPEDGVTPETLMEVADKAMYADKRARRSGEAR